MIKTPQRRPPEDVSMQTTTRDDTFEAFVSVLTEALEITRSPAMTSRLESTFRGSTWIA